MIKALIITLAMILSGVGAAQAQNVVTIDGEATYYGESDDSPAMARQKALEAARINALAREFGTVISQTTVQRDVADRSGEQTFFSSLSASEVNGEWIADDGEPQFSTELDSDGLYIVRCKVRIKARALSNLAADFNATVLRNGTTPRHADTDFRSGDDLFLSFSAPADGFLTVYLTVGDDVMTLLPYSSSTSGKVPVRHGREYVFFSADKADKSLGVPDELTMVTDKAIEHTRLSVLFSPNEFTKAIDHASADTSLPRSLTYSDFVRWLSKVRRADRKMGMKVFNLVIHGN
ncbi:MAG: DUF4384 domain-containing protein [Muribaculaceae bacterium]|nr:DUF4384 domain-containing protein [Muribaculaceae bacterium]